MWVKPRTTVNFWLSRVCYDVTIWNDDCWCNNNICAFENLYSLLRIRYHLNIHRLSWSQLQLTCKDFMKEVGRIPKIHCLFKYSLTRYQAAIKDNNCRHSVHNDTSTSKATGESAINQELPCSRSITTYMSNRDVQINEDLVGVLLMVSDTPSMSLISPDPLQVILQCQRSHHPFSWRLWAISIRAAISVHWSSSTLADGTEPDLGLVDNSMMSEHSRPH